MEPVLYNMELEQFKKLFGSEQQIALGNDFCIIDKHVKNDSVSEIMSPVRLNAYLVFFLRKGKLRININMKEFDMEKDDVVLIAPGHIGHVVHSPAEYGSELDYVIVGASHSFISSLNLEMNRLYAEGLTMLDTPCIKLTDDEKHMAIHYLELAFDVLASALPNKRECLGSLVSSMFYLSEGVFSNRNDMARKVLSRRLSRSESVMNKFLELLSEHHTRERSVGFYAEKLFLTPKYFSKLIKAASGQSVPEWIDKYVIMEAKNYLKYSDLSIKQIVHHLNFPDQPSFTKFFRSHTGQTPAYFRKH